jgi:hypothetical protein
MRALPSGWCFAHDPALAEKRAAAHAAGGRASATSARVEKLTPASLRPILATLVAALDGVEAGDLTPRQGQAMAALAGAIVRIYESARLEAAMESALARLDALERSGP